MSINYQHTWKVGDIAIYKRSVETIKTCPTCGHEKEAEEIVTSIVVIVDRPKQYPNCATVFDQAEQRSYFMRTEGLTPYIEPNDPMPDYIGGLSQYTEDLNTITAMANNGDNPSAARMLKYLFDQRK